MDTRNAFAADAFILPVVAPPGCASEAQDGPCGSPSAASSVSSACSAQFFPVVPNQPFQRAILWPGPQPVDQPMWLPGFSNDPPPTVAWGAFSGADSRYVAVNAKLTNVFASRRMIVTPPLRSTPRSAKKFSRAASSIPATVSVKKTALIPFTPPPLQLSKRMGIPSTRVNSATRTRVSSSIYRSRRRRWSGSVGFNFQCM